MPIPIGEDFLSFGERHFVNFPVGYIAAGKKRRVKVR